MKHQIIRFSGIALLFLCTTTFSQSVGIGTETPNSNAILELVAPDDNQGLLVPRMSTVSRTATTFTSNLSAADNGLLVFDEDENTFYFWMINQWVEMASGNIDALPDQSGQNDRYLTTDGTSASWSDIDFSSLTNVPTDLADGDNDTQLSDADITALGYIKNADDADADASNEFQDLTLTSNTLSLSNSSSTVDLSPFAGTNTDNQTVSLSGTDLTITGGNTLDVSSLVNDADADPTNEDQTVSAGTGISINNVGEDFEVTNTSPDQTVSLTNGGNVTVTGTYPNFTLAVPNNLDNDPTNEDQTVSAGTGISINNSGDDFEVTNTSPDQTVSLTNGGNVTVTGTYPNFTLAVPNNLDNDPTNEDQTVSAGTGISINNSGDDFEVTNTSPDQTVSLTNGGNVTVTGTYPNFTLAVPTNNDNSATNEIELPTQTGQSGNFLTTNGASPSWSSIDESQWNTNGTSINYTAGNVNIGTTAIPTSPLQITTDNSGSTVPQLTISENDATSDAATTFNNSGNAYTIGVDGTDEFFKISDATTLGSNDRFIIDNQGTVGIGTTPNAQFHVGVSGTAEGTGARITNSHSGGVPKIGVFNELDNQGISTKTGVLNEIAGTTSSTATIQGVFNDLTPTDGTVYGINSTISDAGTGLRFGTYNTISGNASNTSDIYGYRAFLNHAGSGDTYAFFSQDFGASSGTEYGVFIFGEDINYLSGNLGIGEGAPSAKLDVVGDTELNGTADITGLLTVTNDIEIPAVNDYSYVSAKTKVQSYHPTEFRILNVAAAAESLLTPNSVNLYVFYSGGAGTGQAFSTAPVKLPDNAVVTQLDAWVVDNDATQTNSFVRVSLNRNQTGLSNFTQAMCQVETDQATESTAVSQLTDTTIFLSTIDNNTYSYFLRFTANDNSAELQLHGVKITYTITAVD